MRRWVVGFCLVAALAHGQAASVLETAQPLARGFADLATSNEPDPARFADEHVELIDRTRTLAAQIPELSVPLDTVETRRLALKSKPRPPDDRRTQLRAELQAADGRMAARLEDLIRSLQPTALVVSGGVSLGAYQAGLLHYYTQYLRTQRERTALRDPVLASEPQVVAGASAGALNAFISALATCRPEVKEPEKSLFFQMWMDVGFKTRKVDGVTIPGLIDEDQVSDTSLLSRKPIMRAVDKMRDRFKDPKDWEDCRATLGLTVTRAIPREIPLTTGSDVKLPVQTERVVLSIEGTKGASPAIHSVDPLARNLAFYQFKVASPAGALDTSVEDVLTASASFPVAWKFVPIIENVLFLDGGVFDNNPLRLADLILAESRGPRPPLLPVLPSRAPRNAVRFLYVEPDAIDWKKMQPSVEDKPKPFIRTYAELISGLVGTARRAELVSTIEGTRELDKLIDVPRRKSPITGSYFLNFMAFLEEDFRRFDFYMGMVDAADFVEKREGTDNPFAIPVHVDSNEFDCIRHSRNPDAGTRPDGGSACLAMGDGLAANNFRALLAASNELREYDVACEKNSHLDCADAGTADAGPIDECACRKMQKSCSEALDIEVFADKLAKQRFDYRESSGRNALEELREQLHPIAGIFSGKQPWPLEEGGISLVTKAGLDALSFRHSRWYWGLGLSTRAGIESEISGHAFGWLLGWLRGSFGMRTTRIQTRTIGLVKSDYTWTMGAHASLDLEFSPHWAVQLTLQAGPGVDWSLFEGVQATSYRFPTHFSAGITLAQRIYVRLNTSFYFFDDCPRGSLARNCRVLEPFQKNRDDLDLNSADISVSVGWHWLD